MNNCCLVPYIGFIFIIIFYRFFNFSRENSSFVNNVFAGSLKGITVLCSLKIIVA